MPKVCMMQTKTVEYKKDGYTSRPKFVPILLESILLYILNKK